MSQDEKTAAAVATAVSESQLQCYVIVSMAVNAGVPGMAVPLILQGASVAHAKVRIEAATKVRRIVEAAAEQCPLIDVETTTAQLIAADVAPDKAETMMAERIALVRGLAPRAPLRLVNGEE